MDNGVDDKNGGRERSRNGLPSVRLVSSGKKESKALEIQSSDFKISEFKGVMIF